MTAAAPPPGACPGGAPLARFRLSAISAADGSPVSVRYAKKLNAGDRISYAPADIYTDKSKAQVSLISIPTTPEGVLAVLESHPASEHATWIVPSRAGAIALVFGPQGMSLGKLADLVISDRTLIPQLADYAEKSARTEMLLETVSAWERNNAGQSLESALKGFTSRYGMAMPVMNRTARPEEQALGLMRALNPALATIDPLAPDPSLRLQQSAGMAATVAGLFFGNPVGLASAGGALFLNMRSILFPGSEFRSALAQHLGGDAVLCAPREPAKSRTQLVYLWAWRIKEPPLPHLDGLPYRVNLGETSRLQFKGTSLDRVRSVSASPATLDYDVGEALAVVTLPDTVSKGDRMDLTLEVEDAQPLVVRGAIEVLGPRPRLVAARTSLASGLPVDIAEGELPANGIASISLETENGNPQSTLHIDCADSALALSKLSLRPGVESTNARLRQSGLSTLFLSFAPGSVGQPGCSLAATLETADGSSDPMPVGRVVRLPSIESFTLTDEMAGERSFLGWLEGEELDAIEKTGWDAGQGLAVNDLPQPVSANSQKQRVRIAMPWPPPAPKSAVFVWLRGEPRGRRTTARY